jgi:hypothetical protein
VSEKSYTIVFEDHPDYLFALVHGDQYGYEVLSGFLKDIADECKRRNFRKVLIEENISATASKEDVYRTASELPELGFAGVRMAYVDRFTDQKEINEFGHDVAVDNGIDVQIFATQAEADAWLTGNK